MKTPVVGEAGGVDHVDMGMQDSAGGMQRILALVVAVALLMLMPAITQAALPPRPPLIVSSSVGLDQHVDGAHFIVHYATSHGTPSD